MRFYFTLPNVILQNLVPASKIINDNNVYSRMSKAVVHLCSTLNFTDTLRLSDNYSPYIITEELRPGRFIKFLGVTPIFANFKDVGDLPSGMLLQFWSWVYTTPGSLALVSSLQFWQVNPPCSLQCSFPVAAS